MNTSVLFPKIESWEKILKKVGGKEFIAKSRWTLLG
jgi:hypothetical protein